MSPLRQRLIEELQLHRKADSTIEAYVAAVADLAKFFQRVRHYGFLANRGKAERLANIRRALGVYDRSTTTIEPPIDWIAWLREIVGVEVLRCPRCGRELQCEEFPRPQRPTALASPSEPALHARPYDDTS
jgi:hypothetical protein